MGTTERSHTEVLCTWGVMVARVWRGYTCGFGVAPPEEMPTDINWAISTCGAVRGRAGRHSRDSSLHY